MPKGYIIVRVTVDNNNACMRYARGALITMKKYSVCILARCAKYEGLAGNACPPNVILEFGS